MKSYLFLALVFFSFALISAEQTRIETALQSPPLMPMPASVTFQSQAAFQVTPELTVAVTGVSDDRLQNAVDRALRQLEGRTGMALTREYGTDPSQAKLVITAREPGKKVPA